MLLQVSGMLEIVSSTLLLLVPFSLLSKMVLLIGVKDGFAENDSGVSDVKVPVSITLYALL